MALSSSDIFSFCFYLKLSNGQNKGMGMFQLNAMLALLDSPPHLAVRAAEKIPPSDGCAGE